MNWRKPVYLNYASTRGYGFPRLLSEYRRKYERGNPADDAVESLDQLLRHCRKSVPFYTGSLAAAGFKGSGSEDARKALGRLPVLRKADIRANFDRLRSADLHQRRWCFNTSGGSTGEPVDMIQDQEYEDRSKAITLLYQAQLGCEVGHPVVRLWGSERDIEGGTRSPKARFFNWLTNTTWMNAFQMSPERMRQFVRIFNQARPRLVVAYAQAAYELARFVERERLQLEPQQAVVTSAGTLYRFMREKISKVFGCPVYNLYGSREVSDIACERPGVEGLWVAPWGNYVEILDDDEQPVPDGEEGNIVVTCLTNYAMPLVRYWIGDRGALMPKGTMPQTLAEVSSQIGNGAMSLDEGSDKVTYKGGNQARRQPGVQVLKQVSGRNVDVFRTRDQTLVDGEYFTHLLYFRPWVWKFQVIQRSYERVSFRVVRTNGEAPKNELEEIAAKSRLVMGPDCEVDFEFLLDLPPHPSGKYRYTISEVTA